MIISIINFFMEIIRSHLHKRIPLPLFLFDCDNDLSHDGDIFIKLVQLSKHLLTSTVKHE